MKKLIYILMMLPMTAIAASEPSPMSKIKRVITYADYGGGDVQVVLETNGTTCKDGYFFNKADPNFDGMLSMLLSAYHAKTRIILDGHTDQKWAGSSGYYCKLYSIRYGF
ncbi:hypothetical protein [Aliikangiella coralliicola]|uniref:OmpA family protein n=1 Tax=Aliikangiella coralliicola TaxID=2592383 RepID=A0A545UAG3_9GAMM|nr:hypothetical protein [Aliikangiella coralliicola]TQV86452.1 hypothetical protein FLL46_16170 [Aliikangiella coralliicola]